MEIDVEVKFILLLLLLFLGTSSKDPLDDLLGDLLDDGKWMLWCDLHKSSVLTIKGSLV